MEFCKYFGDCNGCSLQNLDYASQIENKKRKLASLIQFQNMEVYAGKEYFYRNRLDLVFSESGIGLRSRKGRIVQIEKCMIANEKINQLVNEIRNFFQDEKGAFMYAVIRAYDDSSISFVLNTNSSKISSAVAQIKEFSKITSADSIIVAYSLGDSVSEDFFVVKGKETVNENYLGKDFSYSVQGFFQANHEVAEKMHEYCRKLFQKYDTGNAMLIDLYGGVGTFGIINSDLFRKVFVVEKFKPSAELAKINIEMNGANNAEVLCADARQIARLDFSGPVFVIADPPRSGMDQKTIEILNKILPDVIIYVSCNPAQLGKDIKKFRKYAIKSAALFDMFPQTSHFEAVVELVRE